MTLFSGISKYIVVIISRYWRDGKHKSLSANGRFRYDIQPSMGRSLKFFIFCHRNSGNYFCCYAFIFILKICNSNCNDANPSIALQTSWISSFGDRTNFQEHRIIACWCSGIVLVSQLTNLQFER